MVRLISISLLLVPLVSAQIHGMSGGPGGNRPQRVDQIAMLVFDTDKDGKVTEPEVMQTMGTLEALLSEDPDGTYMGMLQGAKNIAPHLFDLLDSDSSSSLSPGEMKWIATFEKSLKSGAARNLTRDCFAAVDTSSDDKLDVSELTAASQPDGEVLSEVVELVHTAFPLRKDAGDLKKLLIRGLEAIGDVSSASISGGIGIVDTNGDGVIDRKEAGKAYGSAKKQFLTASSTLQEMGPMIAMFGGMNGGGFGEL